MKPSIQVKLQNLAHRLEEVTALLGSPEATADMDNYRRLNQEHAELTPSWTPTTPTPKRKTTWQTHKKCCPTPK